MGRDWELENLKQGVFGERDQVVGWTGRAMTISGDIISKDESVKYLRFFVQRDGGVLGWVSNIELVAVGWNGEKYLAFYVIREFQ